MSFSLRRTAFADLEGWFADDMTRAFDAFRRSARHALEIKPYRTGRFGLAHRHFLPAFVAAVENGDGVLSDGAAREFFQSRFQPYEIVPPAGETGLVTAFYEPVVSVRRQRDSEFRHAFLRPPARLVKIPDPMNPPEGIPPGYAFALQCEDGVRVCPDRNEIDTGALDGQDLEIAYAKDKADVFFAHVQGSARLDFGDGRQTRISYAAKSGHPFTAIGRLLVERGEILQKDISMQAIRRWIASHTDTADELMWQNRSFIFFDVFPVDDDRLGPVAAAKVPLEPGRSMAVDKTIHTFGTPFFVTAPDLTDFDGSGKFSRLMIAQDTGSAILGPARGDLFTGSGDMAGLQAGAVRNEATFVILLPVGTDPERLDAYG